MREVGVLQAKTHFSALIDAVEKRQEDVLITRHGRPVARLTAANPIESRKIDGKRLVAQARRLQAKMARQWPEEASFDWKAAVEEGRE